MQRIMILTALVFLAVTGNPVLAHPGHGSERLSGTPAHYLFDPFHAIWTIATLAALSWLTYAGYRRWTARVDRNSNEGRVG